MQKWAYRQKTGFTIVELLIVVVVIAILAAITIIAYNGIQTRAKASASQSSAASAYKKLSTYAITNADAFPVASGTNGTDNLEAAGIVASGDTTYQYSANNSSSPKTFCITATTGNQSYYINNTTVTAPAVGACPGHGTGGVAAITNYYIDPKPAVIGQASSWNGDNVLETTNVASGWSLSGRVNRLVFTTVTSTQGGPIISVGASVLPYAGQKFTITASVRLTAGVGGIGSISLDRNTTSGVLTTHANGGSYVASLTIGDTRRIYTTFTADAAAASVANNLRVYINIINKANGTTVEFADIDLYPGDYNASRPWHSGDSSGWLWNGTANYSTSTGPAQ